MTDEEKAKELTIKNVTDGKNKYFSWGFYKGCVVGLEYNNKQIAELKEKNAQLKKQFSDEWHFVKDGDLPKNTRYVWTNVGPSYYDDDKDCPCWRDEFGRTQGVIAWCEPKFEE